MPTVRCRECHEIVRGGLREHWEGLHGGKLESIDEWLKPTEAKLRSLVEVLVEQEEE